MAIEFRPLAGSPGGGFGAEVVGAPPNLQVGEAEFRAIEAGWYRHSILLFRGLDMAPDDQWGPGDPVLWDNRCTQHCATPLEEDRYNRLMHRTTL